MAAPFFVYAVLSSEKPEGRSVSRGPRGSLTIESVFKRVWPIGWAPDRRSGQRSSILRARSKLRQGGRCGQGASLKSWKSTFDSCPWRQVVTVAEWRRRATVDRSTRVRFSPVTPTSLGGSQAVRRLILNQIMRRFESSPPSHGRVADWQGAALSMQIMRVQFSPRSPDFAESPSR